MPDVLIRRAVSGDLPVLTQLWAEVFGDSSEMIAAFFRYFPPEQSGWVVCSGTQICSAAYLLTGNQLVSAAGSCDCAYVYAVATPAPQRGHGYASLLMRHFSSLAHTQRLALYTLPAERGLYDWYRDIMGASVISYGTEQAVQACPSDADVLIRPTSPDCYGAARERQLAAQPHLALSKPFLSLAEEYCRMAGGGLFLLDTPDGLLLRSRAGLQYAAAQRAPCSHVPAGRRRTGAAAALPFEHGSHPTPGRERCGAAICRVSAARVSGSRAEELGIVFGLAAN